MFVMIIGVGLGKAIVTSDWIVRRHPSTATLRLRCSDTELPSKLICSNLESGVVV